MLVIWMPYSLSPILLFHGVPYHRGLRWAYILHNRIVIRARDNGQPDAVGAVQDEGVEGADAAFVSTYTHNSGKKSVRSEPVEKDIDRLSHCTCSCVDSCR
jgi:hypothetical protein